MIGPPPSKMWPLALAVAALQLSACATVTVTKVTDDNRKTVKGERYYLPKPVIQVAPQSNGTVAVSVVYLPDTDHEYAIDTSSWMSSYSLQVLPNPDGTLGAVVYQAATTAVAQQAASSAGAIANEVANYRLSQAVAQQSNLNTAQASVASAQATLQAAQAALASDQAANAGITDPTKWTVSAASIAADQSAVAQDQAKLTAAQQQLQLIQAQTPIVGATLPAGAVATTAAAPTPDNTAAAAAWSAPAQVALPSKLGPVLYAVNDDVDSAGKETVALKPIAGPSTGVAGGSPAQPAFAVSLNALPAPTLVAPTDPFFKADPSITLMFSAPIKGATDIRVISAKTFKIVPGVISKLAAGSPSAETGYRQVSIATDKLKAGKYYLEMTIDYGDHREANARVEFELK